MNKKKMMQFALIILAASLAWVRLMSALLEAVIPDADPLLQYLLNKGLFAVLILWVMHRMGGLAYFGVKRGDSWWFLVPGAPFILLTVAVFFSPDAAFGLNAAETVGWILVALAVGIGEEAVYRGILWRAFEDWGPMVTAFITSFLFGAAHLMGLFTDIPWQIITSQAVFAFGVGMMFAAVRMVSGSIMAPIVLHFVFDAGAIVAAGGVREMFDDTMSVEKLLIPGIIFAVWGIINIAVITRRKRAAAA